MFDYILVQRNGRLTNFRNNQINQNKKETTKPTKTRGSLLVTDGGFNKSFVRSQASAIPVVYVECKIIEIRTVKLRLKNVFVLFLGVLFVHSDLLLKKNQPKL